MKCGECQHQGFLPFDDDAVLGHLQGRHVMGIYPMLEDETCWFLGADFDKGNWMQAVEAFLATCRTLPCSLVLISTFNRIGWDGSPELPKR